jgi:predicted nucleotidyltransferase
MQSVHPGVQSYLDQVVSTLTIHVGAELIGVYLHGSLAMGAFDPGRSDIDILAVCAEPLHRERRMVLGEALAVIPTPPSGGDLEFSIQAFLGDIHWAKKEGAAAWEGHDMRNSPRWRTRC